MSGPHDKSKSGKNDDGFKYFARVERGFVQSSLTDGNNFDELLFGVEKDNSEGLMTEKAHFGAEIRHGQRGIDNEL